MRIKKTLKPRKWCVTIFLIIFNASYIYTHKLKIYAVYFLLLRRKQYTKLIKELRIFKCSPEVFKLVNIYLLAYQLLTMETSKTNFRPRVVDDRKCVWFDTHHWKVGSWLTLHPLFSSLLKWAITHTHWKMRKGWVVNQMLKGIETLRSWWRATLCSYPLVKQNIFKDPNSFSHIYSSTI